jgi:hypothetical protein
MQTAVASQPVHRCDLGCEYNHGKSNDQGEGVTKNIRHGALAVVMPRERATVPVGDSGKIGAEIRQTSLNARSERPVSDVRARLAAG